MAADPSSSCDDGDELVELGAACDLDDATSRSFFSDGASLVATFSWPAAEGIASVLTSPVSLRPLCDKHGVPMEFRPVCAGQYGWAACKTPPVGSNTICVYAAALDAGLRFPLHDFYARALRHFQLAPSQLTPNAWSYLAAFVLRCKDAGVEPLVSAFRYFFKIYAHKHDGVPAGWHHFQPYTESGRRLFTGSLKSRMGWKSRFFFLGGPSVMRWTCPVKWGKPRLHDARKVETTVMAVKKLKDLGSVDIRCFLASREMPVGDQVPLHVKVKAEARPSAEIASTSNKRKLPAAMSSPPTSAPPRGSAPFVAAGRDEAAEQSSPCLLRSAPPASAPFRAFSGMPVPPPQQQSFTMSPPEPGFVPHAGMCTSDALQLWEAIAEKRAAIAKADEHAAKAARLAEELSLVKSWNAQYQNQLARAKASHAADCAQLIGQWRGDVAQHAAAITQLKEEHAAAIAQLKEEHTAENAELKQELLAQNAQLREELEAMAAQLKGESCGMGWRNMDDEMKTVLDPDCNDMGCSLVTSEDH